MNKNTPAGMGGVAMRMSLLLVIIPKSRIGNLAFSRERGGNKRMVIRKFRETVSPSPLIAESLCHHARAD